MFKLVTVTLTSLLCNYSIAQNKGDISLETSNKATPAFFTPEQKAEMNFSNASANSVGKADLKFMKANLRAAKATFKATSNFNQSFKDVSGVQWST